MSGTTLSVPAVEQIADVFDGVFAPIAAWRSAMAASFQDGRRGRGDVDDLVESLVQPELTRPGALIIGAGFVASPGYLSDAPWHLAWWLGGSNTFGMGGRTPALRRLVTVEDPGAESFRDHTSLEWWRVPARTGRRHITGPYVDYLCTDDYTLTLTEPVFVDGVMTGVVGADLYVADAEGVLLPALRTAHGRATLVNASARVIASTEPHRATGSLLRVDDILDALHRLPETGATVLADGGVLSGCGDTTLAVVVYPSPDRVPD